MNLKYTFLVVAFSACSPSMYGALRLYGDGAGSALMRHHSAPLLAVHASRQHVSHRVVSAQRNARSVPSSPAPRTYGAGTLLGQKQAQRRKHVYTLIITHVKNSMNKAGIAGASAVPITSAAVDVPLQLFVSWFQKDARSQASVRDRAIAAIEAVRMRDCYDQAHEWTLAADKRDSSFPLTVATLTQVQKAPVVMHMTQHVDVHATPGGSSIHQHSCMISGQGGAGPHKPQPEASEASGVLATPKHAAGVPAAQEALQNKAAADAPIVGAVKKYMYKEGIYDASVVLCTSGGSDSDSLKLSIGWPCYSDAAMDAAYDYAVKAINGGRITDPGDPLYVWEMRVNEGQSTLIRAACTVTRRPLPVVRGAMSYGHAFSQGWDCFGPATFGLSVAPKNPKNL